MPLQRRIPKRGFKSLNRVEYQGVNVRDLSRIGAGEVTPEILKEYGLIGTLKKRVKILGTGEIDGAYQISAHAFSGSARTKIEGAGGTVTILAKSSAAGPLAQAVVETVTENEEAPTPDGDEVSEADDEKA
jgi:large subunit ribosomal protein L15